MSGMKSHEEIYALLVNNDMNIGKAYGILDSTKRNSDGMTEAGIAMKMSQYVNQQSFDLSAEEKKTLALYVASNPKELDKYNSNAPGLLKAAGIKRETAYNPSGPKLHGPKV